MLIKKSINFKESLNYKVFTLLKHQMNWKLSDNEVKVLAALYNEDFALSTKVLDVDIRMKTLFSKEVKKIIIDKINISYNTLNNALTVLRKEGFITNNSINEQYLFDINKTKFQFTIEFTNESN